MSAAYSRTGLAAAVAYLVLSPAEAGAKILLITSGDTVTVLGPIQPEFQGKFPLGGTEVGYVWSYGGLFWVDFWTWGGDYCIKTGENSATVIPAELAAVLLGRTDPPSRPFLYKFPLGLLILGGLVVLGVIGSLTGKKAAKEDDEALDQYRKPQD